MSIPAESATGGTVNILSIVLMVFALAGLIFAFLAFQSTSLS